MLKWQMADGKLSELNAKKLESAAGIGGFGSKKL